MVGVVIIDRSAVKYALFLHAAICTGKACQSVTDMLTVNAQHPGCACGAQCIEQIVLANDLQIQVAVKLLITVHIKVLEFLGHMDRPNPISFSQTKAYKIKTVKSLQSMGIVTVCQNTTGRQLRKSPEGLLYILQILEIIQMICFHIEDHRQCGEEIQERVAIFAAFQHNGITLTYPVTCVQKGQVTADHDGRVYICRHQNMGQHGGGSGFAMGTGNAHCILISLHDHAPSLSSFKQRNAQTSCTGHFRVIVVGSSGADHAICTVHIFFSMSDGYLNALSDQLIGRYRSIHIRTGDCHTHTLKHQAKGTHRNAANAHQVDMFSRLQILLQFFTSIFHSVSLRNSFLTDLLYTIGSQLTMAILLYCFLARV